MFKNLAPGGVGIQADIQESLELAKSAGFGGIDLNIVEANTLAQAHSVQYVKDLWSEAGLEMGAWGLVVDWGASDVIYYESLSQFAKFAHLAAELGCNRCTSALPGWSNELTFKENWDFHVKRLRPAAEILKDYGHSLGLEYIAPSTSRAPFKYGFVHSMDGMLALGAAIGTGNVRLLLDAWHWYVAHESIEDLKKLSADDIVSVHICDAPVGVDVDDQLDGVRAMPAETGVIPIGEFMRIVSDIGYNGPVAAEPLRKPADDMSPMEAAQATSESLDTVWRQAGLSQV
jgi:2-keto-myo-inositol isomerase